MDTIRDYLLPLIVFGFYIVAKRLGRNSGKKPNADTPEEGRRKQIAEIFGPFAKTISFERNIPKREGASPYALDPVLQHWFEEEEEESIKAAPPPMPQAPELSAWTRSHSERTHKTEVSPRKKDTKPLEIEQRPAKAKRYLQDKESVKAAFILAEIIGAPVALRQNRSGRPLTR